MSRISPLPSSLLESATAASSLFDRAGGLMGSSSAGADGGVRGTIKPGVPNSSLARGDAGRKSAAMPFRGGVLNGAAAGDAGMTAAVLFAADGVLAGTKSIARLAVLAGGVFGGEVSPAPVASALSLRQLFAIRSAAACSRTSRSVGLSSVLPLCTPKSSAAGGIAPGSVDGGCCTAGSAADGGG